MWVTIFRDLGYKKVIIPPPTLTSNHRHNWWVYAWHFSLRLDNRIVVNGVPVQTLWALVQLWIKYNRAPHIRPSPNWALFRTQEKLSNQRGLNKFSSINRKVRYPSLELNSEEQINSVGYTKFGYDVNAIIILIIAWLKNWKKAWKRILWKTTSSSWPQSPYKLKIDSQKL